MIKRKIFKSYLYIFSSLTKTASTWHCNTKHFCKSLTMSKLEAKHQDVYMPGPAKLLGGVSRTQSLMWLFFFKPAFKWLNSGSYKMCQVFWRFRSVILLTFRKIWNEGNGTKQWIQVKISFQLNKYVLGLFPQYILY